MNDWDHPLMNDDLGARVRQAAGAFPDDNEALAVVRGRVRQVRRRRSMITAAGGMGAVLVVGALIALGGSADNRLESADGSDSTSSPASTPSTVSTTGPTGMTATSVAPTVAAASFAAVGGAVDVELVDGVLRLVAARPAAGYVVSTPVLNPERIEVLFQGPAGTSTVVVTVVAGAINGKVAESTLPTDSTSASQPDDTTQSTPANSSVDTTDNRDETSTSTDDDDDDDDDDNSGSGSSGGGNSGSGGGGDDDSDD
jgi:hypothetical protein